LVTQTLSSAEVKNGWSCIYTSSYVLVVRPEIECFSLCCKVNLSNVMELVCSGTGSEIKWFRNRVLFILVYGIPKVKSILRKRKVAVITS